LAKEKFYQKQSIEHKSSWFTLTVRLSRNIFLTKRFSNLISPAKEVNRL
jgi:hypothetical protein